MREIKFRAWDTKYGIMLDSDSSSITYIFALAKKDGLTIQQYTGLTDANGVEIYEGDILKCKSYDGWFDKEGFYYNKVVEYTTQPAGESQLSGFLYIPIDREVIGNIFENPELMKL